MVLTQKRAWVAYQGRFVDIVQVERVISPELLQAFREHFSTGEVHAPEEDYFHIYATLPEVEEFYLLYLFNKYEHRTE